MQAGAAPPNIVHNADAQRFYQFHLRGQVHAPGAGIAAAATGQRTDARGEVVLDVLHVAGFEAGYRAGFCRELFHGGVDNGGHAARAAQPRVQ